MTEDFRKSPVWQRAVAERENVRQAQIAQNYRDSVPIVAELRAAGYEIETVDELRKTTKRYRSAIPILVAWLPRTGNPDIKQAIARALSVSWAGDEAARTLVEEFRAVDDAMGTSVRWTLGNALAEAAKPSVGDDLLEIARDRRYGSARQMIVLGLGRIDAERAVPVLRKLLGDPDVLLQAVKALGQLRDEKAAPDLEALLHHPTSLVRREAKRALKRLKS